MANIFLKYPDAVSPTTTIEITRKPIFPVKAQPRIPIVYVVTMGGYRYTSRKGVIRDLITYSFDFLPDGNDSLDYNGILYFYENTIQGARFAFDFVDQDASIRRVRLLSSPETHRWEKIWIDRNRVDLVMEEAEND